jgi:hypothetical protein
VAKGDEASTEAKGKEAATAENLPSQKSKLLVGCCCCWYLLLLLLFLLFADFIFFLFSHICIICTSVSDVATRTATAGTGAVDPSLIGATSSAAPAGFAGTDRFQPSGTDRNSSGGGNSTAGTLNAVGAHYYLSGGTMIAVQTTSVIHKTITIPKNVPKKG